MAKHTSKVTTAALPQEKPEDKNQGRAWKFGIPFTVVAATFYTQGRAYYEAYIRQLGLDPSQLPISTADAYWNALIGWSNLLGKGIPSIWQHYPQYLKDCWLTILVLTLFLVLFGLENKYQIVNRVRKRNPKKDYTETNKDISLTKLGALAATWILSLPIFFMAAMFALASLVIAVVFPFDGLGREIAIEQCHYAAASFPIVHLSYDQHLIASGAGATPVRLIRCSTDFCAVIRDGESFSVPKQSLQRTDGIPIDQDASDVHKTQTSNTEVKVPLEDQLCYRPPKRQNN